MSHFYGVVSGSAKTAATRRGHRATGLTTTAASWQGAVETDLYEKDGVDYARVSLIPWRGSGITRTLYDGPVSGREAAA